MAEGQVPAEDVWPRPAAAGAVKAHRGLRPLPAVAALKGKVYAPGVPHRASGNSEEAVVQGGAPRVLATGVAAEDQRQ